MSLEAFILAHQNLTSFNAGAFDLELFFTHLDLPLLTELFDFLLILDFSHEILHFFLPLFSALVENLAHVSHQVEVLAVVISETSHQAEFRDEVDLTTGLLVFSDD